MATSKTVFADTYIAGESLVDKEGYLVKASAAADNTVLLAGAGEAAIGVLLAGGASGTHVLVGEIGKFPVIYGDTVAHGDELTPSAAGKAVTAGGGDVVCAVALASGVVNEKHTARLVGVTSGDRKPHVMQFRIPLASISDADLITVTPGYAGKIRKTYFVADVAASTSAKTAKLGIKIGTTVVAGGICTLTTANLDAVFKVVEGSTVTGDNVFTSSSSLKVYGADTTAFAEGAGTFYVVLG
jgi:hypothetical protein